MIKEITLLTALFSTTAITSTGLQYNYIRPEENEYATQSQQVKKDNIAIGDLRVRERILRRKKNKSSTEKNKLKNIRASINELMKK